MLPERYRRLWRRRLRRRPLVPFLFAATIAANVMVVLFAQGGPSDDPFATFLVGVSVGQIGLLGAWVVSRRFGVAPRVGWSSLGAAIALLLLLAPNELEAVLPFGAIALGASVLVCGAVELAFAAMRPATLRRRRRNRFSMGFLIGAMLVAPPAVLVVRLDAWPVLLRPDVLVPVAIESALLALLLSLSKTIRGAALFGLACLAGQLALAALGPDGGRPRFTGAYYLGYATVIGSWLTGLKVRGRPPAEAPPSIDVRV